jgi:TPR repeat protein
MLAYMYEKGEGVPNDKAQAHTWFQKAAEQGYLAALRTLSREATAAERTRLSDASIEHGSDGQRDLLPNLLDSALHRSNERKRDRVGNFLLSLIGF